jgi:hypothetical protein
VVAAEAGAVIASWRGLALAIGVAIVLAIIAMVGGGAPAAIADRSIAPGFAADGVTGMRWRGGGADLDVRARDHGWQIATAHGGVPADPSAIRDVLAALRGGRWQRAGLPVASHRGLVVDGATPHVIGLGEPLPGGAQTWITVDGRGLLVDSWIARALDPSPFALRVKRPLDDIAGAEEVVITSALAPVHLRAAHVPWLVRPSGVHFLTEPVEVGALMRALREIEIVRLPDSPSSAHTLTIASSLGTLTLGGPCAGAPALVAVAGTWGDGCIDPAAAQAVAERAAWFRRPDPEVVARALVPDAPAKVTLVDHTSIDVANVRVGDAAGDPREIRVLAGQLTLHNETVGARPTTPPVGQLTVELAGGAQITLWLYAPHMVARGDEPFAVALGAGPFALLRRPAAAYRDPTPWREEPTMISTIEIDGVRFTRGDVIGAWARAPGGPVSAPAAERLEALAKDLAHPYASRGELPVATAHTITVTVAPPVGAPITHRLALGAAEGSFCPAAAGGDRLYVSIEICRRAAMLVRRSE